MQLIDETGWGAILFHFSHMVLHSSLFWDVPANTIRAISNTWE